MNIAFDLDEVLAAFQYGWIEFNDIKYGTKLNFDDITEYDYSRVMGLSQVEVFRRIFEFYDSDIFPKLKPIEGSADTVAKLIDTNDLYIITSRPSEIADLTKTWVDSHFPECFKEILQTGQISRRGFDHTVTKADLCKQYAIDWLVEDAPMHAQHVADAGIHVALLAKPWNSNIHFSSPEIVRISTITEFPQLIA